MGHGVDRVRVGRQRWRFGPTLFHRWMMALTAHGDVGHHAGRFARLHVPFAVVAIVGQYRLDLSQRLRQCIESPERRFDFLFVVGVRCDGFGDDEQGLGVDPRLHVIGLLETLPAPPA